VTGFIELLYIVTTSNYDVLTCLLTLKFTIACTKFSQFIFTVGCQVTDCNIALFCSHFCQLATLSHLTHGSRCVPCSQLQLNLAAATSMGSLLYSHTTNCIENATLPSSGPTVPLFCVHLLPQRNVYHAMPSNRHLFLLHYSHFRPYVSVLMC
jgi:hypothetical protein